MILTYGAPDTYCVRCALRVTEVSHTSGNLDYRQICDEYSPPRQGNRRRVRHDCPTGRVRKLARHRNPLRFPRVPMNSFGHLIYDPAFFLPQMAVCPDCSAPVGQPCINRGVKLPKPTKHAHKARNFAALKARGLALQGGIGGRVLYTLDPPWIDASDYPWCVQWYPKGTLTCEDT